jgi:hypothetical protein
MQDRLDFTRGGSVSAVTPNPQNGLATDRPQDPVAVCERVNRIGQRRHARNVEALALTGDGRTERPAEQFGR